MEKCLNSAKGACQTKLTEFSQFHDLQIRKMTILQCINFVNWRILWLLNCVRNQRRIFQQRRRTGETNFPRIPYIFFSLFHIFRQNVFLVSNYNKWIREPIMSVSLFLPVGLCFLPSLIPWNEEGRRKITKKDLFLSASIIIQLQCWYLSDNSILIAPSRTFHDFSLKIYRFTIFM